MKKPLPFLLTLLFLFIINSARSQTLVGASINGDTISEQAGTVVSMSNDGKTVAISSPYYSGQNPGVGKVRVFELINNVWTKKGSNIIGEGRVDYSGLAMALSGDGSKIIIGSKSNAAGGSHVGHARVYEFISPDWVQVGSDIDGDYNQAKFGGSVAISDNGNRIAIGTDPVVGSTTTDIGYAAMYELQAGAWVKMGSNIAGEARYDRFGHAIAMSGDGETIAISSPWNTSRRGQVKVFKWDTTKWVQVDTTIKGLANSDYLGGALALSNDGTKLLVGSPLGPSGGYIQAYELISGKWQPKGSRISGTMAGQGFGFSVSISANGSTIASGAPLSQPGYVKVFEWVAGSWTLKNNQLSGATPTTYFGNSVSLSASAEFLAIGIPRHDVSVAGSRTGQVIVYGYNPGTFINTISENSVTLYPNPTNNQISISGPRPESIEIQDVLGRIIQSKINTSVIDFSDFKSGLYIVTLNYSNNSIIKKVIRE